MSPLRHLRFMPVCARLIFVGLVCLGTLRAQGTTGLRLVLPQDEAVLYQPYPMFSWLSQQPGSPLFTLRIAEVLAVGKRGNYQSKEAAILSNPAIYEISNIRTQTYVYPVTAPRLQAGKKYAWQVLAINTEEGGETLAQSEVHLFSIPLAPDDSVKEEDPPQFFYRMRADQVHGFVPPLEGKLPIQLHSNYKSSDFYARIYTRSGTLVRELGIRDAALVAYGDNRYKIQVSDMPHGQYQIVIEGTNRQLWYLNFIIN
ncbi:MAG: hypothetical protein LW884_06040 [Bacteroidetes bacterium]|jgi:hypothetical protein|nr:hypothetical protein [Bacteroidota bacterium]